MVINRQRYREKVSRMISWGHWFALFNILFTLVLGSRYLFVSDWPASLPGRIYAISSLLGHFSFIVFTAYLLIIFPLTFVVMSQRWLRVFSAVIATTGLTLLLVDSEIFTRFYLHLSPFVWELVVNPEQSELARDWQLMFICAPVIFLLEMTFGAWCWQKLRWLRRYRLGKSLAVLFISAFLATHLLYIWADANFYRPITMQKNKFPLSHPMTARTFLEKHRLLDKHEYQRKLAQFGDPAALAVEYPLSTVTFNESASHYNLLMVVIDGPGSPITLKSMPTLVNFANSGIEFTSHYNSGYRKDTGLLSLFYGISSAYLDGILAARRPSELIIALSARGYQFGFFSSDGFDTPLYRQALLADFSLPAPLKQSNWQTALQWQKWITHCDVSIPWFSYINLHGNGMQATAAEQHGNAHGIDDQIAAILNTIEKKGISNNTVIIITAVNDNGANNGRAIDNFSRQQLRTPLLIHWPDIPAQKINKFTSHEDIMTTLMQKLLYVKNSPSDYSQGEDLFAASRKHNWMVTGENGTLIITMPTQTLVLDNNGTYQLFDFQGNQIKNEKPHLALLLQVLTDVKRFIAD